MKTQFNSLKVLVGFVALSLVTSATWAAGWGWDRDAGAKMRGEYGTGSVARSTYVPQATSAQVYAPVPAADSFSYRSYSYQPAPAATGLKVGDIARATTNTALTIGDKTLGTLASGQQVHVVEICGSWIGVEAVQGGKTLRGWVRVADLSTLNAGN